MNSSPDDFRDLRRLLALKRHEKPPPGYFSYLPDKVMMRLERDDLSEYSTWWQWLVQKLDAQPVLAGAYAFAISGLMLLGFKLSHDLQHEAAADTGLLGSTIDPTTLQPGTSIQRHFANPAPLLYFTDLASTEPAFEEPPSVTSYRMFPARGTTVSTGQ
jgi:hypothetical protein